MGCKVLKESKYKRMFWFSGIFDNGDIYTFDLPTILSRYVQV